MDVPSSIRVSVAFAALVLLGCGSGSGGQALENPPRVSVSVPGLSYAGVTLPVTVSVTGCDQVEKLSLYDGKNFLRALTYQPPSTDTELQLDEIPYSTGIAAKLSLNAQVTCDDGRAATSQPQPVSFLPVAAVTPPPEGSSQTVTDIFTVQGQGQNTGFVGCTGNPNGTASLVRVNLAGAEVSRNDAMPIACNSTTQYSDLNGQSQSRWAWAPLLGAMSLDQNLGVKTFYQGSVNFLTVGPEGDALIYDAARAVVQRLPSSPGGTTWTISTFVQNAIMLGPGVIQANGRAAFPYLANVLGVDTNPIAVTVVDYQTGTTQSTATLMSFNSGFLDTPNPPPALFNSTGTSIYLPIVTPDGNTTVYACNPYADGCDTHPQWRSASLKGKILTIVPFADDTKLAAVASNYVWFLDAASGTLLNKGGTKIQPTGNYVFTGLLAGKSSDFYMLAGKAGVLPVEVIMVDDPAKGELVRFETQESSLMVGVGDDGQSWLRVGSKLMRPLPLDKYRQVRPP